MEHWTSTDEIKTAARAARRALDAKIAREESHRPPTTTLIAAEGFPVRGRGVVIWLDNSAVVPTAPSLQATIASPGRLPIVVRASLEIVDDRAGRQAFRALLLHGLTLEDVPPGASVDVTAG